jgi:hypothetical protein
MSKDILEDLKSWLAHVRDEREIRQRMGRTPEREIERLDAQSRKSSDCALSLRILSSARCWRRQC